MAPPAQQSGPGPGPPITPVPRRPRGRPRVRTELERRQRRRAWHRQRYRRSADLGGQSERWRRLRRRLGHERDEETAAALLDRYFERSRLNCSGQDGEPDLHPDITQPPSLESLRLLVLWAHTHGQDCPLAPAPHLPPPGSSQPVSWSCPNGHRCPWEMLAETPTQGPAEGPGQGEGGQHLLQMVCESDGEGECPKAAPGLLGEGEQLVETELLLTSDDCYEDPEVDSDVFEFLDDPKDRNYVPSSDSGSDRDRRHRSRRNTGRKGQEQAVERRPPRKRAEKRPGLERPRKIRKKIPKQYVRCEFEGCGKIVSNPQYLKRHMKYQHHLQRTFPCSHPTCSRIFRFKTQMEEHVKLHSDQRDYICEFCGRAFKTDKNLVVHRRIHTGEKPLQCEICGFTCRQKASLNWHMKKHDAESGYQFSCDVCGKRFEKKDNVSAHKSKSHPEMGLGASGLGPFPRALDSGQREWGELQGLPRTARPRGGGDEEVEFP